MKKKKQSIVLTGRAKEFETLFLKSGWGQTETAKRLKLSSSNYVYMILHGRSQPSSTLLELFRMKVEERTVFVDSEFLSLVALLKQFEPTVRTRVAVTLQSIIGMTAFCMTSVPKR